MQPFSHTLRLLLAANWLTPGALGQPSSYVTSAAETSLASSSVGSCQLQTLAERRPDTSAMQAPRSAAQAAPDTADFTSGLTQVLAATAQTISVAIAEPNATSGIPGTTADNRIQRLEAAFGIVLVLAFFLWFSCRGLASSEGEAAGTLITDAMTYRMEGLASWQVFFAYSFTIWDNDSLWNMGRRLALITVAVAMLELLLASDPSSLDPLRFSQIGTVLHVFAALLLSFFLTSSVNRWFNCVDGVLDLINAIRNLQMQLQSLGVPREHSDKACRLGLLSAWGLNYEMNRRCLTPTEQTEAMKQMWTSLEARTQPLSRLLPEERALLEGVDDFPGLVWVWVGSLMGRLAQDGDIPPMTSPTYGHITDLAQQAQAAMRQVRSSIAVQMPFPYVHTLATIVHLNNILSAISFGLTLGASTGSILVHIDPRLHLWDVSPHPGHYVIQDAQSILIQFFQCFVAPIVYLSFFEIGLSLASPFGNEDAAIPVERFLETLEQDLQDGSRLAANPPLWERPQFKAQEAGAPPKAKRSAT